MKEESVSQQTEEKVESEVQQEPEVQEEQEAATPSEEGVVEVSWEDIQPVIEVRTDFEKLREEFSHRLLSFERMKERTLDTLNKMEEHMYRVATELRHANGIPDGVQYELKLPTNEGEKAYFIRKDV